MNHNLAHAPRFDAVPTPVTNAGLPYRPDIDGLRAVAVGAVIIYHAFPKLLTGGFIGVDVFFVISGYLISQIIITDLRSGRFSLVGFYRRRARRILPALLLVLATCAVFGWIVLLPTEFQWLGRSMSWCAAFLANIYFARTGAGYFQPVEDVNPLLHLWSLGVEEQFYIAWPVLLMLVARRRLTLGLLLAVFAISLAASVWGAWHDPRRYFYFPVSRAWELAVGALIAWQAGISQPALADDANPCARFRYLPHVCSLAGLLLIAVAAVGLTARLAIPGFWSVIPVTGAALSIAAGPSAPLNRWLLSIGPMRFVGQVSYPLYLWHWPLFSFVRIFLGRAAPPALAAAVILMAFIAACATYRWLEVPIRRGARGRRVVPGLLAALAGLALLGAAAGARWLPGRLTGPLFVAWDAAVTDWQSPPGANLDRRSGIMTFDATSRRDRKALFVGDSHIEQYWPRAAQIVEEHPDSARSAAFVTYRGCPPLPGIDTTWPGTRCHPFFDYAMRRAFEADVDTVVFGAFWEKFFLGEYAAQPAHGVRELWPAPLRLDAPGTQLAFEQFQQAVASLVASGRRVFIVLSNPTSPLFEPRFPAEVRWSLHSPRLLGTRPGVDSAAFESFVSPLTDRLRSIAARAGAEAIDPRASLCDATACPAVGPDGLPLYLDSNHLRATYARMQASFVDDLLMGHLPAP